MVRVVLSRVVGRGTPVGFPSATTPLTHKEVSTHIGEVNTSRPGIQADRQQDGGNGFQRDLDQKVSGPGWDLPAGDPVHIRLGAGPHRSNYLGAHQAGNPPEGLENSQGSHKPKARESMAWPKLTESFRS